MVMRCHIFQLVNVAMKQKENSKTADLADHFTACSRLGRYLTVIDGSRFVISDDFREGPMGNAAAAAIAAIYSRDSLVAHAALLPLSRRGGISPSTREKYERLFTLIESQALDDDVTKAAHHIVVNNFREAEIAAIEAELGDKISPARLRYRAFLNVIKQIMDGRVSSTMFLEEFRDFTRSVAGKLDFGIYSFCLDRLFASTRISMKVKKFLIAEIIDYPPLVRRELLTNLLTYPGQDREIVNFSKGLVKSELEPAMVVEIELLESFKRERISMHDIGQAILPAKYK